MLVILRLWGPVLIEKRLCPVIDRGPYSISDTAISLHNELFIADLHSDILLYRRDILKSSDFAQTDIPRQQKANWGLQTYAVPTYLPSSWNYDSNDSESFDLFKVWVLSHFWPVKTWYSMMARAKYMSEKLYQFAYESGDELTVIHSKTELEIFLEKKRKNPKIIAGVLLIEGMQVIEGKLLNIDKLYDLGYRAMGISHFHDNRLGGSCSGEEKYGLTEMGKQAVKIMEEKGIVIDLSHASRKVYKDVLSLAKKPLIVSHTGVQRINPISRNMTDEEIIKVSELKGVIGVGFWDAAVKEASVYGIVNTIDYIRDLVGEDFIALGSDFDGAINAPFTAEGLPLITEELINRGYSEESIRKIMGENVIRVYKNVLN